MLQDAAWESARTRVCRSLGLSAKPGVDLGRWCREPGGDYRRLAAGLADNPNVRIEQRTENSKMRDHLVLTGLDKLAEPASLKELREGIVRASQILPVLAGQDRPSPRVRRPARLGRANAVPRRSGFFRWGI
ncbi:hypothetical protein [Streptomyces sp. NBC_01618]|uniref:hypothetical protein n=1 Tax=Streptomyces sp. NBC_01618 TaxID=2975900 RepID=UPI003864A211|nr:hypothetical protein OH735_29235 [Streptomyces sp. NBC_01618]